MSTNLGLHFESQDWGIVNADSERLSEFIQFYESENLAPSQRFELGELILASANERLRIGVAEGDPGMATFARFILSHWKEQEVHIAYWSGLERKEEFPAAGLLKDLTRHRPN